MNKDKTILYKFVFIGFRSTYLWNLMDSNWVFSTPRFTPNLCNKLLGYPPISLIVSVVVVPLQIVCGGQPVRVTDCRE